MCFHFVDLLGLDLFRNAFRDRYLGCYYRNGANANYNPFAVSHLIGVTFAPRIKDPSAQTLVGFSKMKSELTSKGYPIKPTYYVNEHRIRRNWDNILRLIATIKLREHRASTILKRLGEYSMIRDSIHKKFRFKNHRFNIHYPMGVLFYRGRTEEPL